MDFEAVFGAASWQHSLNAAHSSLACCNSLGIVTVLKQEAVLKQKGKQNGCYAGCPPSALALQVFQTMAGSGVQLTITTFGTLLIAGAGAHDYNLVQEVIITT